jgi:hypothetical protein
VVSAAAAAAAALIGVWFCAVLWRGSATTKGAVLLVQVHLLAAAAAARWIAVCFVVSVQALVQT